jgi:hypothetical protein
MGAMSLTKCVRLSAASFASICAAILLVTTKPARAGDDPPLRAQGTWSVAPTLAFAPQRLPPWYERDVRRVVDMVVGKQLQLHRSLLLTLIPSYDEWVSADVGPLARLVVRPAGFAGGTVLTMQVPF